MLPLKSILKSTVKSIVRRWKRKQLNLDRLPVSLRDVARKGIYIRANPYPVESLVEHFQGKRIVTKQTRIITMGSCFAQELHRWLSENNYTCLSHEWGIIFSPQSIAQIIQYSFETETWQPEEPFWIMGDQYYDPYIKAIKPSGPTLRGQDEESAWIAQKNHYKNSAKLLRQAELAVWTLGLTELWRNKKDHKAYYTIPYEEVYNPNRHEFYNSTYEDVLNHLNYAITTFKKANPTISILLSVSPVPLSLSFRSHLGPYIATQYSKSILHSVALTIAEKYNDVFYMPSYEITRNNPLANYRADGRHVNRACVNTIMKAFKQLYVVD